MAKALSKNRFEVLDSFRGISAILVAILHIYVNGYLSNTLLIRNCYLLVDFFFVLSGFIISFGYMHRIQSQYDVIDFIKKRIARIYPLHLFMTLMFVPFALIAVFMHVNLGERFSLNSFIQNLFLIQSFGLNESGTWNIPAWSISTEFYTYIIFALCVFLIPAFRKNAGLALSLGLGAAVILFYFSNMHDTYKLAFIRCLYSFFIGVCTFFIYKRFDFIAKNWMELIILTLLFLFFTTAQIAPDSLQAFSAPFLFSLLILVFSKEAGVCSSLLKNSALVFLGKISFTIYLVHGWVILVFKSLVMILDRYLPSTFFNFSPNAFIIDFKLGYFNDLFYIPYLAIVILLSWWVYHKIEMPSQKKINSYQILVGKKTSI